MNDFITNKQMTQLVKRILLLLAFWIISCAYMVVTVAISLSRYGAGNDALWHQNAIFMSWGSVLWQVGSRQIPFFIPFILYLLCLLIVNTFIIQKMPIGNLAMPLMIHFSGTIYSFTHVRNTADTSIVNPHLLFQFICCAIPLVIVVAYLLVDRRIIRCKDGPDCLKKICKRIFAYRLLILAIVAASLFIIGVHELVSSKSSQESFSKAKIGMSRNEIIMVLGMPERIYLTHQQETEFVCYHYTISFFNSSGVNLYFDRGEEKVLQINKIRRNCLKQVLSSW
jgi:hypothetical protein